MFPLAGLAHLTSIFLKKSWYEERTERRFKAIMIHEASHTILGRLKSHFSTELARTIENRLAGQRTDNPSYYKAGQALAKVYFIHGMGTEVFDKQLQQGFRRSSPFEEELYSSGQFLTGAIDQVEAMLGVEAADRVLLELLSTK